MQQTTESRSGAARRRKRKATIIAREGGRCALCGQVRPLTLHHIRPKVIGGENLHHNLVAVCGPCHDRINWLAQRFAALSVWCYGVLVFWVVRRIRH